MITTVTLNPCIDLTVRVPSLRTGALNLVTEARTDVAGKGVNVSVVLRALGLPTICAGINYHGNGKQLEDHLEFNSICHRFAMARGDIRTNIKVYDDPGGEMTELNHRGIPVDRFVIDEYLRLLRECAESSEMVVFSGRIPAGESDDIYRRSIKSLKGLPVKVVVDAEGGPLREALHQKPTLIKPNLYELKTAFRCKTDSREDVVEICRRIIQRGVEMVCVSMGERGALLVDRNAAFYAPPLTLEVRGLQGAGDSMVAGLCKGIREHAGLDQTLRYGVAAASASLEREGTQLCRREDFDRLLPRVKVERLNVPPLPSPASKPRARAVPKPAAKSKPKSNPKTTGRKQSKV